jgi:hypothetical protein
MPKHKCNFTDNLKAEFPFLKEESGGGRRKVFCTFAPDTSKEKQKDTQPQPCC